MSVEYGYSQGDLLEERNTYFYTDYLGHEFLESWRRSRSEALTSLPPPTAAPRAAESGPPAGRGTADLLERIMSELEAGRTPPRELDSLLKRFEVTKRIHGEYDEGWRAVDRQDYRTMALYVRFAEAAERSYASGGGLPYLNVLLKVVDTLVALRPRLSDSESARLAALIIAERGHVDALERRVRG